MDAITRLWAWIWNNPGKTARILAAIKRIMWPAPAVLLCLALTLALAGCAANMNKIRQPIFDKDGKAVLGTDGQPLVVEQEFTDAQAFFEAQKAAHALRRPVLVMEAKDGEIIELKGVKSLTVWGYSAASGKISQWQHPWAQTVREWGGVAGAVAGIAVGGYFADRLAGTVAAGVTTGATAGGTHISNSFNPTGAQSPPTFNASSGAVTNTQPVTNTTTTSTASNSNNATDSHDTTSP